MLRVNELSYVFVDVKTSHSGDVSSCAIDETNERAWARARMRASNARAPSPSAASVDSANVERDVRERNLNFTSLDRCHANDDREEAIERARASIGIDRALASMCVALGRDERESFALARGVKTLRVMGFASEIVVIAALLASECDCARAAIVASTIGST